MPAKIKYTSGESTFDRISTGGRYRTERIQLCLPSVKKGHRFKSKGQLVFFFSPTERAEMRDQDHLQRPPNPPDPSPFTPAFSVQVLVKLR